MIVHNDLGYKAKPLQIRQLLPFWTLFIKKKDEELMKNSSYSKDQIRGKFVKAGRILKIKVSTIDSFAN